MNSLPLLTFLCWIIIIFLIRPLTFLGFPNFLNHFHFLIELFAIYFVLVSKNLNKFKVELNLSFLFIVLVICTSFLNGISLFIGLLSFLSLFAPFVSYFLTSLYVDNFLKLLTYEKILNFIYLISASFAFFQYLILGLRSDDVTGTFIGHGAGCHVLGTISFFYFIYTLSRKNISKLIRIGLIFLSLTTVLITDTKQVFLYGFLSFLVISSYVILKKIINLRFNLNFRFLYLFFIFSPVIFILLNTQQTFIDGLINTPKLYIGFFSKLQVFEMINNYSGENFFNYLFGHGPASSASNLAKILPDILPNYINYESLSNYIFRVNEENYFTNTVTGSSLFSLFFSFSGIYGDYGYFGLILYSILIFNLIYRFKNNLYLLSMVLTFFISGLFYYWPEEVYSSVFIFALMAMMENKEKLNKQK